MTPVSGFVQRLGPHLLLDGQDYRIAGGNNYYLAYVDAPTQDSVLALAQSFGMNALRIWAFLDTPKPPVPGEVSFQYWDPKTKQPLVNDGPNGLERLDRAIAKAGALGIRVILTLINNWKDFGGIPQYVQWFGMSAEKERNKFYSDSNCMEAYQKWVHRLVTRKNTVSGLLYRDDPAILAWELANEPRCEGKGGVDELLAWTEEMSWYVRGIDTNHLIALGDEGYFKRARAGGNTLYNGGHGVSCEEILGITNVDFGTMHMYPDAMAKDLDPTEFGLRWIREHMEAGERADKPMLLEEYGMLAPDAERDPVFDAWLKSIEQLGGVGDMLWMMGLPKSAQQPYDPDGYVVSAPAAVPSIGAHAARMLNSKAYRATAPCPTPE
jgi:mannan endo-1,4-beta-mannosidase